MCMEEDPSIYVVIFSLLYPTSWPQIVQHGTALCAYLPVPFRGFDSGLKIFDEAHGPAF